MRRVRAPRALLVVITLWLGLAVPASAYLKFGITTNGQSQTLRWRTMPVRYFVSDALSVSGVTVAQFAETVARAFGTWETVPMSSIRFERTGFTSARPSDDDAITVLGFQNRPELDRVLGSTSLTFDVARGEIVEADIFFNAAFPWSVAPAAIRTGSISNRSRCTRSGTWSGSVTPRSARRSRGRPAAAA